MFRSHSDHPQGGRMFLVKVTVKVTLTRNIQAHWRWSEWWSKHVGAFL